MATKAKQRTLYYRRAVWTGRRQNLQKYLIDAHKHRGTTKQRTFQYGDGEIEGINWKQSNNSFLFHITEYVPHQPTSLVPFPSAAKTDKTSEFSPPSSNHFLEGDIFCFLKNNHLLLCPSGAREAVAESYIQYMLRADGNGALLTSFEITPIIDLDRYRYIRQHGVKRIELNSSLYEATVDYEERRNIRQTLLKEFSDSFISLFKNDPKSELRDITDKENLSVKLIISYDKRGHGDVGWQRMIKAGSQLARSDEDEGFKIVTGDDQAFSADEIRIKEKVKINSFGKSIDRESAWEALEEYYEQLRSTGALQQ